MASPGAESDNDVVVMDTITSKYFESGEQRRSRRGRSETPPVAKEAWPTNSMTPSPDILTRIVPTQQGAIKTKPRDGSSSQGKFIPRCKRQSPENDHGNSHDIQVPSTHHNTFAKNQGGTSVQSQSSGKAKRRLPDGILTTTPTLSGSGFSFSAGKKPAATREAKTAKKTVKSPDVSQLPI